MLCKCNAKSRSNKASAAGLDFKDGVRVLQSATDRPGQDCHLSV